MLAGKGISITPLGEAKMEYLGVSRLNGLAGGKGDWIDELLDEVDKDIAKEDAAKGKRDSSWSLDDVIGAVSKVVDGGVKLYNSAKGIWQDPPPGYKYNPANNPPVKDNTQMYMLGAAALVMLYLYTQKK